MKSIRLLTSVAGGVEFAAGWEGEVADEIADDLIQAGHAEPINPPHTKTATKPSDHTEKAISPAAKKAEKR